MTLTLPVPPTDNRYYGKPKGKLHKYVTKAGRVFRHEVILIAHNQGARGFFAKAKVAVKVTLHLPSGGDIQNRFKALCDALQHANVIDDDKQIVDIRAIKAHPVRGGRCIVTIWEA